MAARAFSQSYALAATSTLLDLTSSVGPNDDLYVTSATVINTNASTQTVTINLASDGGAAATSNLVESGGSCSVDKPYTTALSGKIVPAGGKLYANASTATNMTLQISGQIVPKT